MKAVTSETKTTPKGDTPLKSTKKFPIVAIGASAGGLEALEYFLRKVPENCNMGIVVIQHLDPTQKGMLPELLQRVTPMKVFQVSDRMTVKPNCVYVIPPNKSMSILKGVLHLFEPIETRGLRLPIDFFMRSLADDVGDRSIGVILSGMGSDGSLGVKAIKEKNGIVAVQDPVTAKYDSMPNNAIESVVTDIIAPADLLPGRILEFLKAVPVSGEKRQVEIKDQSALEKIIILLRTHTGNDFSLYKKNTLYRRIERRISVHKMDKISSYVRFLQENPKEVHILFKELMIGVTNFFRDAKAWDKLKETILKEILEKSTEGSVLRAWVPGCSTGEEAYSLAIVFREIIEKSYMHKGYSLQIFATDLDAEAINIARKGLYPVNIVSDVSSERLNRFFSISEEGYRVKTEIREMVVFAQHNVILHPPFTRIDVLSCRNLLIYMDSELQKKIVGLFYYSLNNDGVMFLGSSETLGSQSYLFAPVDVKMRIYKRAVTSRIPDLFDFPSSFSRIKSATPPEKTVPDKTNLNIETVANQLLLQHFSPASVLVNENGDIIYIHGHTGKYLEPAVGKANLNIFAMLRDGLRKEFPHAFRQAVIIKEPVVLHDIKIGTNGGTSVVDVHIQWIDKPEILSGSILIIFTDSTGRGEHHSPVLKGKKAFSTKKQKELQEELQRTREEIQNTLEQVQTSQEELKSTNEELQSTNEELQSTNEELTTSKEEMQSLNEELQTVNAELQSKVDDYSRVNNDMKNLLNSTEIATLFLDKELNIRRYTQEATKIFKLIKSDVGRQFTDQVSTLDYPDLATDANEVLRTLVFIQKEIPSKDGRWFSVRIMPYRTFDDRIDGLVITFINITNYKKIETKLLIAERLNNFLSVSSVNIIIVLSSDLKIMEFNAGAEKFFGRKSSDCLEKNFSQVFIPEKEQKPAEQKLKKLMKEGKDARVNLRVKSEGGEVRSVQWLVNLVINDKNKTDGMILTIINQ